MFFFPGGTEGSTGLGNLTSITVSHDDSGAQATSFHLFVLVCPTPIPFRSLSVFHVLEPATCPPLTNAQPATFPPLMPLKSPSPPAGDSPDWQLERVEVVDTRNGQTFVFPCNAWFGRGKVLYTHCVGKGGFL